MKYTYRIVLFVNILVLILIAFLLGCALNVEDETKPTPPMKVELTMNDKPYLNKDVTLTLLVTPQIDAPNTKAEIILPEGIELVSGDLLWEGGITQNKTVEVSAVLKVVKIGDFVIKAGAHSFKDDTSFGSSDVLYLSVSEIDATVTHQEPKKEFDLGKVMQTDEK